MSDNLLVPEFELRAWCPALRKFYEPAYYLEQFFSDPNDISGDCVSTSDEVSMFTGKIDIGDKKIFTGDHITNGSGRVAVVVFDSLTGSFDCECIDGAGNSEGLSYCDWSMRATICGHKWDGKYGSQ